MVDSRTASTRTNHRLQFLRPLLCGALSFGGATTLIFFHFAHFVQLASVVCSRLSFETRREVMLQVRQGRVQLTDFRG